MRRPDETIPTGEPAWLFYEVDAQTDHVLRIVELFEDGSSQRNSLALESLKRPVMVSLVAMKFCDSIAGHSFELIPAEMFDQLYAAALDRPE